MDDTELMEETKIQNLDERSDEPEITGEQIGLLTVVIGMSGLGGVYTSTLFESLIQQLLGGLSATVLIFGLLVIVSHLLFGDSD